MTAPQPAWDIRVLGRPVVIEVPTRIGDDPDPLLALAAVALERHLAGAPTASRIIGQLAHSGVVALRTISTVFEIREQRDGWLLVRSWGDPEPAELAAAAWIRAHRLARERADAAATLPDGLP
ncbi:hypothetical protein ThrDRAFT_02835 [Frankia casuarinae]|uniref:hypothetical protein n=1 Tax=Frankia TaxID=1854 RepID=UPI0002ED6D97|nr:MULTISPECIES: hypothetical protein [Frankia]EYT91500.1 hypothetical protein ThrDRAFT_02835 [Frankia casuarinae]TFE27382.1 hypothetical protein E0F15_16340 [Frankia sp. B2]